MLNGATPDGAWAGREDDQRDGGAAVLACLAQLLAHRPHRHRPVLGLDDDPDVAAARDPRVEGQHEVALLRLHDRAGLGPGPVEQVAGAAGEVGQHRLEQVLEVAALGGRPGSFGAARGRGRLDRDEALLERLEAGGHLLAELVHRGVEPGRVEQRRELRGVAVEVALEHRPDAPDRAVALRLVEQLVDHRPQRAAVAEEPLERARQPSVAVGEVRAERLLERERGLLVDRFGLTDELLELGPDDVDVDRDAGVLEREQADPQRAPDELGAVIGRALGEERGQRRIVEDQPLHDDPVTLDADTRGSRRGVRPGDDGERWERGGFHAPNHGAAP